MMSHPFSYLLPVIVLVFGFIIFLLEYCPFDCPHHQQCIPHVALDYFPGPVVTNYHKLLAYNNKFIFSPFWMPKVWNVYYCFIEAEVSSALPQGLKGRICPLPFPGSSGCQHSLTCGLIILISTSIFTSPSLQCVCSDLSMPPFYKDMCDCI